MKAATAIPHSTTSIQYKVDLAGLQAVCDANYLRLLKLASQGIIGPVGSFEMIKAEWANFHSEARIKILEQTRYTTLLTLEVTSPFHRWTPLPCMTVRMYHDVRMAEVIAINNYRNLNIQYEYPNQDMHQPDEKHQMNRLLAEWLESCLSTGYSTAPFSG